MTAGFFLFSELRPRTSTASQIAAEIAGRVFAAAARRAGGGARGASGRPRHRAADKPALRVAPFVSESDVRLAMSRGEKILIGPRSIVTPSARDLGNTHEIFVETEGA